MSRLISALLGCSGIAGLCPGVPGQTTKSVPPGGTPILGDPLKKFSQPYSNERGRTCVVDVNGPGFSQALEAESSVRGNNWDYQVWLELTSPLKTGDVLLVHYWARTPYTADESGQSMVQARIEIPGLWKLPQKEKDLLGPLTQGLLTAAGSTWQQYFIPAESPRDMPAGEVAVVLRCGIERQRVQFGGMEMLNYGNTLAVEDLPKTRYSYAGRETDAPWRKDAQARIHELRTREIRIRAVDARGGPVAGMPVEMELTRHAFEFGAACRACDLLEQFNPNYKRNRERILENFSATSFINALKWHAWVGDWGARMRPDVSLQALRWVKEQKLPFRGHCLVWPRKSSVSRAMRRKLEAENPDPAAIQAGILEHMRSITSATDFWMDEWDVLNESIPCRDVQDICGNEVMVEWFREARRLMPGVRLALNEYNLLSSLSDGKKVDRHEKRIQYLLDKGAPVDVLGMQSHMGGAPPGPERMLSVLDRFAEFGLPIRITEFDLQADNPDLQYDFTRDFYTLVFSHPSVIGIQMWGIDQMYTESDNLTPVGRAFRDLVHGEWRANVSGLTDDRGEFATRGFFGRYRVRLKQEDTVTERVLALPAGEDTHYVELQLRR